MGGSHVAGSAQGFYKPNSSAHTSHTRLCAGPLVVKGRGYSLRNAHWSKFLCDRPTIQTACGDPIVSCHRLYSYVGGHDFLLTDLARAQLMSAVGPWRTPASALHMSANDPK